MSFPVFSPGEVLNASDMNAVGLWLVKSQTVGTGVSTVAVTGAFSADYDNYLITYSGGTASADNAMALQLTGSTSNYFGFLTFGNTTGTGTVLGSTMTGSSWLFVGGAKAGQAAHLRCDLMAPFLAINTKLIGGAYQNGDNYGTSNGEHRVASSYTGFSIGPGVGTITGGTIRVYGYRN